MLLAIALSAACVIVVGITLLISVMTVSESYAVEGYRLESYPDRPIVERAEQSAFSKQSGWVPELPVRLVIPAIDVDALIQYVGVDPEGSGEMAVPANFTDVGWYEPGVQPGMSGSAVIAGHFNGKEIPEAVFYDLERLEVGDEVIIWSANRIEDIFRVVKVETYAYDDSPIDVFVSTDGKKRLNLITCGGAWLSRENQYDERTVVFTELVTDVE